MQTDFIRTVKVHAGCLAWHSVPVVSTMYNKNIAICLVSTIRKYAVHSANFFL